jgi:predicted DNA-binding transcriptional regulator YafY
MKLDRLLAITMMLLNQQRVNATELAERFEVSLRTIYRDMESINQAGIPIVSFPGSDGGYEIMKGYRIDKQIFSLDDFSAIVSALRGVRSATDNSNIEELLERIGAMIPNLSNGTDKTYVDLDFTPFPTIKDKIRPLHKAIKVYHLVHFEYLDNKGVETERTVEPMGLFLKGNAWYFYGYCLTRSDFRVFRLSRILHLKTLPELFVRRNYSLEDVERKFREQVNFSKMRAVLLFKPAVKTRVRDEFGSDQMSTNPDGSLSVNTYYSSMARAIQNILSYGTNVLIVDPPELIEEIQRHIKNMAKIYKN